MRKSILIFTCLSIIISGCEPSQNELQISTEPTSVEDIIDESAPGIDNTAESIKEKSESKNIVYATSLEEDGINWTLDVYSPNMKGEWPTVVLIHGLQGTKEGYSRESEIISKNGAIVYTLNWPDSTVDIAAIDNGRGYRDMSETISCAIQFAQETTKNFGGDPDHITLIGHSYGAGYGIWFALGYEDLNAKWKDFQVDYDGPAAQVECVYKPESVRVNAYIGIGGGHYSTTDVLENRNHELWEIVSPLSYLGKNMDMPIRLLHGDQDTIADPESSQVFNEILLKAGYDSDVILYDGRHNIPPELTFETVIEISK